MDVKILPVVESHSELISQYGCVWKFLVRISWDNTLLPWEDLFNKQDKCKNTNVNEHKRYKSYKARLSSVIIQKTFHIIQLMSRHLTVSSLFTSDLILSCLCFITTTWVSDGGDESF